MNIHSHLFGSLLFCVLLGTFHQTHMAQVASAGMADIAVFVVFLCSAVACLFMSAFYHTCGVHSKEASQRSRSRSAAR